MAVNMAVASIYSLCVSRAVLSFAVITRGQDSVKHYTVTANDDGYVFGLAKFADMTQFLEHFESQPLLGGESGYSHLNVLSIFL